MPGIITIIMIGARNYNYNEDLGKNNCQDSGQLQLPEFQNIVIPSISVKYNWLSFREIIIADFLENYR